MAGDTLTFTVPGGSISVEDLGNGFAICGEWDCDGSDPYAAVTLYKKAEAWCNERGLVPVVYKFPNEDWSDLEKLGWEMKAIVLGRKKDGK